MANADEVGGVSGAQLQPIHQLNKRPIKTAPSGFGRPIEVGAIPLQLLDSVYGWLGKFERLHNLGRVGFDVEQLQHLRDPPLGCSQRAAVRVGARDVREFDDPRSALVPREAGCDLPAYLRLSHLAPKHGSRSRSIALKVPGGKSWLR